MGTDLQLSTAFHLQSDGQSELIRQTLENMLGFSRKLGQND